MLINAHGFFPSLHSWPQCFNNEGPLLVESVDRVIYVAMTSGTVLEYKLTVVIIGFERYSSRLCKNHSMRHYPGRGFSKQVHYWRL